MRLPSFGTSKPNRVILNSMQLEEIFDNLQLLDFGVPYMLYILKTISYKYVTNGYISHVKPVYFSDQFIERSYHEF